MTDAPAPLVPHYESGVTVVRLPAGRTFDQERDAVRESRRISALHSRNKFWDPKLGWVKEWNDRRYVP